MLTAALEGILIGSVIAGVLVVIYEIIQAVWRLFT